MPRRLSDVWEHFNVLSEEGRKKHGSCLYCQKEYKYSNSTRLATHIVQCENCPEDIKDIFKEQLPKAIAKKVLNPAGRHFVHRKIVREQIKQRHIVWEHFKNLNGPTLKKRAFCIYCETELRESNIPRLLYHLKNCEKCPEEVNNKFKELNLERFFPNNSYDPRFVIKKSKQRPIVWDHFRILDKKGYKRHAACNYCGVEYKYSNATRLVVHLCRCPICPDNIKTKFMESQNKNAVPPRPKTKKEIIDSPFPPTVRIQNKTCIGGKPSSDIWQYFRIISEVGYKKHGACIYCGKEYHHCNATRLLKHIVECQKSPEEVKKRYLADDSSSDSKEDEKMPSASTHPSQLLTTVIKIENDDDSEENATSPSSNTSVIDPLEVIETSIAGKSSIDEPVGDDEVDIALAKAIYASGVPPDLLESKYWKNVINILRPNYKLPSVHDIKYKLLDAEHKRTYKNTENEVKSAETLTLACDLIRLDKKESILSYFIMTPKPLCYRMLWSHYEDYYGHRKYFTEEAIKIINEIGPKKVVALITEHSLNLTVREICSAFPNTTSISCLYNTLNISYQDIAKEFLIASADEDVRVVVDYLNKHILPLLKEPKNDEYRNIINSLTVPNAKDWKEYFKCFELLLENKDILKSLAATFGHMNDENQKILLLSETWWDIHYKTTSLMKPIIEALEEAQSDKGILSDVPEIYSKLQTNLEKVMPLFSENYDAEKHYIRCTFQQNRTSGVQPIHMAANLLDPRYIGSSLSDDEITEAMSYISNCATSVSDDPGVIMKDLAEFKTKTGYFGKVNAIWTSVHMIEPRIWWTSFCCHLKIAPIAVRLLSVPCSIPEYKTNLLTENVQWNNQQDKDRFIKYAMIRTNCLFTK